MGIAREISALLESNLYFPEINHNYNIHLLKGMKLCLEAIDSNCIYTITCIDGVNGDKLSFRCFALDKIKNTLFLPAFGDLTGGYPCKKSFKKWAIVSEEEIIEIKS